ncbi:hypothetical protein [Ahniella affigens]|nr:hypothetical protein [Ahniella affigens]
MTMLIPSSLLRFALKLDAGVSAPFGLFSALLVSTLAARTALPASLILITGLVCLPYAALLIWLSGRQHLARFGIAAIVIGNLLWADAAIALAFGWLGAKPSSEGLILLAIHAIATGTFAVLQAAGWYRSTVANAASRTPVAA